MNRGLRILMTNNTLAGPAGSEMYVRDVALGLMRRGHNPVAYSTMLGEIAEELRRATIPVIDDLRMLREAPDVIHGQHHLDAMTAMLHFPEVPAVFMCHGWAPWEEIPPAFPSIARYIAVDDLCRERLLTAPGLDAEKVLTLYNFVDLPRFQPRPPLPPRPRNALVFGNEASHKNFANTIRAACQRYGIEKVDTIGRDSGNPQAHPEHLLPAYDVVFAKARCALEAMAVGCAVIVASYEGLSGMVTLENVEKLRRLNFGARTMQAAPITEEGVLEALGHYDADAAKTVSDWIRANADMERTLDRLETIYRDAAARKPGISGSSLDALRAGSVYLRSLAPVMKDRAQAEYRARTAESQAMAAQASALELQSIHNSSPWKMLVRLRKIGRWLKECRRS